MQKKNSIPHSQLLCQQYLAHLYHEVRHHPTIASVTETYGEILYSGINKLISKLPLCEKDIFVDLGSGLGKAVLQVFLQTNVKEARGIEIIPELQHQALIAKQKAQQDLPAFFEHGRELNFLTDNFLENPPTDATVLLMGSICFTPTMLKNISNIINHSHHIHTVFSLRPLCHLTRLKFQQTIRVECSWDAALGFLYG